MTFIKWIFGWIRNRYYLWQMYRYEKMDTFCCREYRSNLPEAPEVEDELTEEEKNIKLILAYRQALELDCPYLVELVERQLKIRGIMPEES